MSKHTPGPWAYQEQSDAYTHIVRGPDNLFICQLSQTTSSEIEANARLIAAAPELLDLLERVTYHMEGGIQLEYPASPEESPQPASEWDHRADRLAGEARRLLAKATVE